MATTVPTSIPASVRAGDTVTWSRNLADYPASAGWDITTTLVKAGAKITIVSAAAGDLLAGLRFDPIIVLGKNSLPPIKSVGRLIFVQIDDKDVV